MILRTLQVWRVEEVVEGVCPIGGAEHYGFGLDVELRRELWVLEADGERSRGLVPEIVLVVVELHTRTRGAEGIEKGA